MIGLILGIIMFMVLVILHELGHFRAAKKFGVKVLEFGIGIPPKIKKLFTDKSGTQYTANAIPLGGFVRLKGEDPKHQEEFHAKDSFIKAKLPHKVIILLGGIIMNIITARILFTVVFWQGMQPITVLPENAVPQQTQSYLMPTMAFLEEEGLLSGNIDKQPAMIDEVLPNLIADDVGLQSGDVITKINDKRVNTRTIGNILQNYIGEDITITYEREGETKTASSTCPDDNCLLGVTLATSGTINVKELKFPLGTAMINAGKEIHAQTNLTFNALGRLGKNLISFNQTKIENSLEKLTGPAGAIKFGDTLRQQGGRKAFIAFAGMISLALAIFNILPIPALDGGRLLGALIQGIGRLKPEKYFTIEGYINVIFFILLMGLGVYILLKDLVRFWGVNIPFLG